MAWAFRVAFRGYTAGEVDALLQRVTANQVTASELREARFSRQMRGYSPRDVDAAIAEILRDLEQ